jgi:hypothetical protein
VQQGSNSVLQGSRSVQQGSRSVQGPVPAPCSRSVQQGTVPCARLQVNLTRGHSDHCIKDPITRAYSPCQKCKRVLYTDRVTAEYERGVLESVIENTHAQYRNRYMFCSKIYQNEYLVSRMVQVLKFDNSCRSAMQEGHFLLMPIYHVR